MVSGDRVSWEGEVPSTDRGPMSLTCLGTERSFGYPEALGTAPALNPQLSRPALGVLTSEGTSPANLLL